MGEGKDWSFAVSAAGRITQDNTERPGRSAFTGLAALVAATTMLLAALTSAYIVRRGLAGDWTPVRLPLVLPGSVLLFILSSLALEISRRRFKIHRAFASRWFGGVALGVIFVLTEAYAWKQISESGISVAGSPAAAFLYVLTGAFSVFVIAAIVALIWAGVRARRGNREISSTRLSVAAFYWHYLDGLWLYLVILLYLRS
jgi:cytochrome c oxidase subunit III